MRSHPYAQGYAETDMEKEEEEDYEQRLLEVSLEFIKQYIRYARTKYHPTFTNKSAETIQKFYEKLRKYSKDGGGINIVPRHL
jgi:DNA replicative helicase MCM subunit Mcm2 (Cdc46/Mcm family)